MATVYNTSLGPSHSLHTVYNVLLAFFATRRRRVAFTPGNVANCIALWRRRPKLISTLATAYNTFLILPHSLHTHKNIHRTMLGKTCLATFLSQSLSSFEKDASVLTFGSLQEQDSSCPLLLRSALTLPSLSLVNVHPCHSAAQTQQKLLSSLCLGRRFLFESLLEPVPPSLYDIQVWGILRVLFEHIAASTFVLLARFAIRKRRVAFTQGSVANCLWTVTNTQGNLANCNPLWRRQSKFIFPYWWQRFTILPWDFRTVYIRFTMFCWRFLLLANGVSFSPKETLQTVCKL